MIKHIVMWKLKDSAEGRDKLENARIIKEEVESLKNEISEIIDIEVGINIVDDAQSYDIVLYSTFASSEDLDKYQKHPLHVKVAGYIGKVRESRVVVDYEI